MTLEGRRILVVEDEFLVALTTLDILKDAGCLIVGPVARVPAALALAKAGALDAAILDIDLDGERVWAVADELRRRRTPFLFLSAYAGEDVVPARFAAAACLDKPAEKDLLLNALAAMWPPSQGN